MAGLMAETINTKTLTIELEMLDMIGELDEFKGAWRALSTLAPERLSALRHVATIESIGSSTRIEGSKLSDREVEQLLANLEIKSFATRDEQEVAGYAEVMETVFASWSVLILTENHIKQLRRDLLRYAIKDERHRGEYKKLDNHVEAFDETGKSLGVIFETATPFDTPRLMEELVAWASAALSKRTLHPLLVIAIFVVLFLQIHPFQDGNGRLSRVLTTLLLLRAGYAYVPFSSLESVIEQSKDSYYLSLRRTQKTVRTATPNWQPWVMFFLRALQQHKRKLEAKVEREKKILGQLPELALQIYELARERGQIKVEEIIRATASARNGEGSSRPARQKRLPCPTRQRQGNLVRPLVIGAMTNHGDREGEPSTLTPFRPSPAA
jgi:Fic family protein